MKERPILFSGPMVRALLDGRKTQTRRILKADELLRRCTYGQSGDRLWVRETWGLEDCGADGKRIIWQADRAAAWALPGNVLSEVFWLPSAYEPGRWRPSIHMPRWASRLSLEVTEVRVQRLQDISESDILSEGVTVDRVAEWCGVPWSNMPDLHAAWRVLWDSINGERPGCSWDTNPWVWAISFKAVEPQKEGHA